MPRRGKVIRLELPPDAKYANETLAKFINRMMLRGQKATAERIVYSAFDLMEKETKQKPLEIFEQAVKNATPLLQVKPRRVAGATYQVPLAVPPDKGQAIALRWLINSARSKKGKSMAERLASELSEAARGEGITIKRREDLHHMAEANRAFVHYRW